MPTLPSYLQGIADKEHKKRPVCHNVFSLVGITCGSSEVPGRRAGLMHLLPLSIEKLTQPGLTFGGFEDYVVHGFLPRVHSQKPRHFSNLREL